MDNNSHIPVGYCQCGCGEKTKISHRNSADKGWIKGQPRKYLLYHQNRKTQDPFSEYAIVDCGYITPCWIWNMSKDRFGYGMATINGVMKRTHRHFYERFVGEIPEGKDLHHLCNNPPCCNPEHLQSLTRQEHIRVGPTARLKEEDIPKIRELYQQHLKGNISLAGIGREYGIHYTHVKDIGTGKSWSDIKYHIHDPQIHKNTT